jgi:sugar O-acyltransferase (sialic acid O-acetyltransferase NeuD family)
VNLPGLLLIGAGGHALACIEAVERDGRFAVTGLVGSPDQIGQQVLGYPVLGADADLPALREHHAQALIAVGQIRSHALRQRLFELALSLSYWMPAIMASSAHVSRHAVLGAGTVVMPGASVNAGAQVGRNTIVNTAALIEHGAVIGDHCHVSTGAVLNGDVHIGEGSFIGSGTVVKEGVRIGRGSIVGMGLAVRHDLPDYARFTGTSST